MKKFSVVQQTDDFLVICTKWINKEKNGFLSPPNHEYIREAAINEEDPDIDWIQTKILKVLKSFGKYIFIFHTFFLTSYG